MDALRQKARQLDAQDPLRPMRDEFLIPTRAQISSTSLPNGTPTGLVNPSSSSPSAQDLSKPCTYLCGNSLGLQPRLTSVRLQQYLSTWATQGVQGHFKPLKGSPLPTWLDADEKAAEMMADIVGAKHIGRGESGGREGGEGAAATEGGSEVAVMQTLTANLHLLMSAFYRPDRTRKGRHMIMLEERAFPSDYITVETQLRHHSLSSSTSMLKLSSPTGILSTSDIISAINTHASSIALILLPGIQYYTGQLLDIPAITAAAHKHGIFIIWDIAHAVGNVELKLHEWDVDAAVWCTYKYLNAGPGAIGGMFVHERHSGIDTVTSTYNEEQDNKGTPPTENHGIFNETSHGKDDHKGEDGHGHGHRLAGWWANDKSTRFHMANTGFRPVRGTAGFQLSNPSILDITSLCASLEVFTKAGGVRRLREKSVQLTRFLQDLLEENMSEVNRGMFQIITPRDKDARGAQLSLLLKGGQDMLDVVMRELGKRCVIVDERRPDVVRVAPAPLYNSYEDCVDFAVAFMEVLDNARQEHMDRDEEASR